MNKARRTRLQEVIAKLEELDSLRCEAMEMLSEVIDEEQEAHDNMPESVQYSEKGEQMQEYIDSMQSVYDDLDSVDVSSWIDTLNEIAEG